MIYCLAAIFIVALAVEVYENTRLGYFIKRKWFAREIRNGKNPKVPIFFKGRAGVVSISVEDLVQTKSFKRQVAAVEHIRAQQNEPR